MDETGEDLFGSFFGNEFSSSSTNIIKNISLTSNKERSIDGTTMTFSQIKNRSKRINSSMRMET